MKWLLILFGILANATASILVKVAGNARPPGSSMVASLMSPTMILAVGSYGLAFILYSLALMKLPLNVAHPIMTAGAIVVVGISSVAFFREPLPLSTALGYAMLLGGIVLLSLGVQRG